MEIFNTKTVEQKTRAVTTAAMRINRSTGELTFPSAAVKMMALVPGSKVELARDIEGWFVRETSERAGFQLYEKHRIKPNSQLRFYSKGLIYKIYQDLKGENVKHYGSMIISPVKNPEGWFPILTSSYK